MQSLETTNDLNTRIDWVDVSKAIAIFFIYFGHWVTANGNLAVFSYSFHLQLFFIVSGFFAVKQQKKDFIKFVKNQFFLLIIPFFFFTIINIIYFNLDGTKTFNELISSFTSNFTDFSNSVAPELWFLPALFCVSVFYYILLKLIKSKVIILTLGFMLFMIKKASLNAFLGYILVPFITFFGISSIPEYLFFYALGALAFPYLTKVTNKLNDNSKYKRNIYLICSVLLLLTVTIYFFKPDMFIISFYELTGINTTFTDVIIRLILTLIICTTVFFISYIFKESKFLLNIGKNTLILLGFEFIIKDFLVLNLIPMFNLGIVKLETTVQVISISILMVLCVIPLFKPLNTHIPFLVGKRK